MGMGQGSTVAEEFFFWPSLSDFSGSAHEQCELPLRDAASNVLTDINSSQLSLVVPVCSYAETEKHKVHHQDADNQSHCHWSLFQPLK